MMKHIWNDQNAQDLVEYTLLLAFVAMVTAGITIPIAANLNTVWSVACSDASTAAVSATS